MSNKLLIKPIIIPINPANTNILQSDNLPLYRHSMIKYIKPYTINNVEYFIILFIILPHIMHLMLQLSQLSFYSDSLSHYIYQEIHQLTYHHT